jgi:acyl phosphate:glycerol-3-phosphate acyltransferase
MDGGAVIVVAAVLGYLIGSLPTANGVARMWGVDLRKGGSGNPGANNARRLGGYPLAVAVLLLEMSKGVAAVAVGLLAAGDLGSVLAGIGAVAGNVYNVWYSFRGGKGLAISAGVLLAAWPVALPFLVVLVASAAALTRSTGVGALITLVGLVVAAVLWAYIFDLPTGWGANPGHLLTLALGMALLVAPKHLPDAKDRITQLSRP